MTMKKTLIFALALLIFGRGHSASNPAHAWFEEARFGMFVHFGPYAVLANGEWIMHSGGYTIEQYHRLQHIFDPHRFDARKWVALAKEAGMKYITFTSRHHDGFSNWDTRLSTWNIMNTPYGKDLVRQLADECHREGIKLVLYYSLLDWTRSDYSFSTGRTGKKTGRTQQDKWEDYLTFMKSQLTELLTNYGEISGIWFDGEWDQMTEEKAAKGKLTHDSSKVDWRFPEIYDLIHSLQPNCMIANNHHLAVIKGEDYQAFEKDMPGENTGAGLSGHQEVAEHMPMETCETVGNAWGYYLKDKYKDLPELITLLVRAAGYGANLLLNVGPMPTGEIDPVSTERLKEMGKWTAKYGYTIYGTQAGVVKPQSWGAATRKGNIHYIHILKKDSDQITLPFSGKIKSARWLNAAGTLTWKQDKKTNSAAFTLDAPMDDIDTIIEVVTQ